MTDKKPKLRPIPDVSADNLLIKGINDSVEFGEASKATGGGTKSKPRVSFGSMMFPESDRLMASESDMNRTNGYGLSCGFDAELNRINDIHNTYREETGN